MMSMKINFGNRLKYLWHRLLFICLGLAVNVVTFGQTSAGSMKAGTEAIDSVADSIAEYIGPVQGLLYSIAGVVALGGAISVYIKMNNEDQDVKKSIMMILGACIFLIAAAQALPAFFGLKG